MSMTGFNEVPALGLLTLQQHELIKVQQSFEYMR